MYSYVTNYGGGVVLAPAGAVFLGEVALCANLGLLPGITNLGELGNAIHLAEGWTNSDHNPFVKNPQGLSYVRAFDFGGPVSTWVKLIEFWNHLYALKDPRVYWPGYTNSDQAPPHGLTIWYSAGLTRQGTDGPHAHLSLARANTTTSGLAAWTPALDSLAPWGLQDFLTGHTTDSGTATPITEEDDMPYTEAQLRQFMHEEARAALAEMAAPVDPTTKTEGLLYGRIRQAVLAAIVVNISAPGKVLFDRIRQAVGLTMDLRDKATEAEQSADAAQAQVEQQS